MFLHLNSQLVRIDFAWGLSSIITSSTLCLYNQSSWFEREHCAFCRPVVNLV